LPQRSRFEIDSASLNRCSTTNGRELRFQVRVVVAAESVVVVHGNGRHREIERQTERRLPVVGDRVILQVVIREHDIGPGPDPESQRRRDAALVRLDDVAVTSRVLQHRVDAQRSTIADDDIAVHGDPSLFVAAERRRDLRLPAQRRELRRLVDHAACRTAPEQQRRRALQDFDGLDVEQVAVVFADIAQRVEEDIAAGRESASQKLVWFCVPPSGAVSVIPVTLRSASDSVVMFCERISSCGTMSIDCAMSRSGVSIRVAVRVDSVLSRIPCRPGR
jgi:hypothetical protein